MNFVKVWQVFVSCLQCYVLLCRYCMIIIFIFSKSHSTHFNTSTINPYTSQLANLFEALNFPFFLHIIIYDTHSAKSPVLIHSDNNSFLLIIMEQGARSKRHKIVVTNPKKWIVFHVWNLESPIKLRHYLLLELFSCLFMWIFKGCKVFID